MAPAAIHVALVGVALAGVAFAAVVVGSPAHAQPAPRAAAADPAPDRPSDAPLPSCLDASIKDELGRTLEPRGVQKREFLKNKKLQLTARGGLYAGDLTSSSWVGGGALTFWFTEDLGLELGFQVTPVALDLDDPLADFFGDDRFEKGLGYLPLANLVWSPIHTKMKIGDGIVHGDFLVFAGGGRLFHDSVQGVTFDAGVALELLTTGVLTVRFEARDVMAVQEAVAETRFTHNLMATLGLSLWIPTWL
ncbi:MAG: outer membrane beta-barrel domain-containing protein [Kofleriaceae bacterium]|nr:outer membrane beta-barrel domain-containing protein [Kofleriaceae bacterium]MCL4225061.1 outer membrane beta-barrel domain-containing protein [Myxococcales bacterium]